jgi:hypothetical protein
MVVPDDLDVQRTILDQCHDKAGHLGIDKTQDLVQRRFWWPKLVERVREYVTACPICAKTKSRNYRPAGQMVPLPIPTRPWECVTLDLVTDLPQVAGKDSMAVFVDKLTKMIVAIPVRKTITSGRLLNIFVRNIVNQFGKPDYLVSDRDPRYFGRPWRSWMDRNSVLQRMSSAYHPQTDGQSERANRTLLDMLRAASNARMDNWVVDLPRIVEHYNNSVNLSTGHSPNFLNFGFHRRQEIDRALPRIPNMEMNTPQWDAMRARTQAISNLQRAQQKQKKQYDRYRRAVVYQPGDKVYLSTQDLRQGGPQKLLEKWIGPFTVVRNTRNVAYELEMPASMGRLHRVFHVSKLKTYKPDDLFQRAPPPPPQLGDGWFEIEGVYNHRLHYGREQYRVRFAGFGRESDQWLDANLVTRDAIDEYWATVNGTQ